MSHQIFTTFSDLNLKLDTKLIEKFETLVLTWEIRGQHAVALNSQTIGVHPIAFTPNDRVAFFETFGLTESKVKQLLHKIPYIDQDRKVVSDPFNVFSIWLMHLGFRDISSQKTRDEFLMNVAKFLHYRFFTSLVNYYFSHGANEKIMAATINSLSKKFDIVIYGTWKKTIEARCQDLISTQSIHIKTLENADDDQGFLYVITDIQSRIRDKIKNIFAEYIATRDRGDMITSRAATTTDREGEKILVHTTNTLDLMIYNLENEVLVERLFIDNQTVDTIAGRFTNISSSMLKEALQYIVSMAKTQSDSKQLTNIKTINEQTIYIGMNAFIENLIQKTYRYCINSGVDVTNKAQMWIKIKNIYSSSRINDADILDVKNSMQALVDRMNVSRRETTIASLRLALLMYVMVRSFRFI